MSVQRIQHSICNGFIQGAMRDLPYRHWFLKDVLPNEICTQIIELPLQPPVIEDTQGRRETHNLTRQFFNAETNKQFPVCQTIADAFQSNLVISTLQKIFQVDLTDTYLRLEYCLDTDGFWLAPHTDLGVKKFTMLLYLSTDPGHEAWGTDIFADAENLVKSVPGNFNSALVFVPANNTWHGFNKRTITGLRRSLIINYVTSEWQARHELSFPNKAVNGSRCKNDTAGH